MSSKEDSEPSRDFTMSSTEDSEPTGDFTMSSTEDLEPKGDSKERDKGASETGNAGDAQADDGILEKGDIPFSEFGQNVAKGALVKAEATMDSIWELLKEEWKLPHPQLIISVTGGAKVAKTSVRLEEEFRRGLMKAARSTGAWLITVGTPTGVTRQVGLAVRDHGLTSPDGKRVPLIGVTPLGAVQDLEKENPAALGPMNWSKISDSLDSNHSHFLLVHDGSKNKYGTEIDFRAKLEAKIAAMPMSDKGAEGTECVPAVLLMFEGGRGTLKSVSKAVENQTPAVIIKGSGRAADVLAFAYEKNDKWNTIKDEVVKKCNDVESTHAQEWEEHIKKCLDKRQFLTILELKTESSVRHLDKAILKALLNHAACMSSPDEEGESQLKQLRLALIWDRVDVAQSDIDLEKLKADDLKDMTTLALEMNRVEFLELFLDYGAPLLEVTRQSLENLFDKSKTSKLSAMVKDIIVNRKDASGSNPKLVEDLGTLLEKLIGRDYFSPLCKKAGKNKSDKPLRDLLLWAVLTNKLAMAKILWKQGEEKTMTALMVSRILRCFAENKKEKSMEGRTNFQRQAQEWSNLAASVLGACYEVNESRAQSLLVFRSETWNDISCVLTAVRYDNKHFASQTACHSLRQTVWHGNVVGESNNGSQTSRALKTCCSKVQVHPWNASGKEHSSSIGEGDATRPWCPPPRVTFVVYLIAYLVFLALYSYMLLVALRPEFSWVEEVVFVWVIAIFIDFYVELAKGMRRPLGSWLDKLKYHFTSPWNCLDLISTVLFFLGMGLWMSSVEQAMKTGRVFLALSLIVFFLRFLYNFTVSKWLGPKMVMIGEMLWDLASFCIILLVFLSSYAIASEAILYPNTQLSAKLLYTVPRKAFWSIFGEFSLNDIEAPSTCTDDPAMYNNGSELRCPTSYGSYVVPILMGAYILITNVLLLNLLIAMFTHTFTRVQENTELHWHFSRLKGVHEMTLRSPVPPPFNLLYYACALLLRCFRKTTYQGLECGDEDDSPFLRRMKKEETKELIQWEKAVADSFLSQVDQESHRAATNPGFHNDGPS